jgi:hypothetical protein
MTITNMDATIFTALDHHKATSSPSTAHGAISYPCPILSDLICTQVDSLALLDLITSREGRNRGQSLSHVSLDVRDEEELFDPEHRNALVEAGVLLLVNDAAPR